LCATIECAQPPNLDKTSERIMNEAPRSGLGQRLSELRAELAPRLKAFWTEAAPMVVTGWSGLQRFFRLAADWLARLSWLRLVLLIVVVASVGGWLSDTLRSTEQVRLPDRIRYDVNIDAGGDVQVTPHRESGKEKGKAPGHVTHDIAKDLLVIEDKGKGSARVSVGKEGVVIEAHDGNEHKRIIVNKNGVQVLDANQADKAADSHADEDKPLAPGAPASPVAPRFPELPAMPEAPEAPAIPGAPRAAIELPPGANAEQIREALDQVKNDLESIATEQRTVRRSNWASEFVGMLLSVSIVAMLLLKIEGGRRKKAEARASQATELAEAEQLKRQLSEARMQTMQAQVEPHFLFNTLASIDHLIETDPPRASAMQKNLILYLRNALPKMRETATTLGREVDLVTAYLDILKMRMEERLTVVIDIPDGLRSGVFPPMMLQSLVENAIKHGLEPCPECATLTLRADVVDGMLQVSVADTGIGFDPANARTTGTGLGLTNIRERLALMFDGRANLEIKANTPRGTVATIALPYNLRRAA
jgi:signal transduction histidine kinase